MRAFIVRILALLSKVKIVGRIWTLTYQGEGLSLNKFYAQGHWRTRQGLKDKYKALFMEVIQPALVNVRLEAFYLLIFYNSRHDCDNVVGMAKIFVDCLKGHSITGDGKTVYKGIMIFYDDTLPHNTFQFVLIEQPFRVWPQNTN